MRIPTDRKIVIGRLTYISQDGRNLNRCPGKSFGHEKSFRFTFSVIVRRTTVGRRRVPTVGNDSRDGRFDVTGKTNVRWSRRVTIVWSAIFF